jgi:hypothetical protein
VYKRERERERDDDDLRDSHGHGPLIQKLHAHCSALAKEDSAFRYLSATVVPTNTPTPTYTTTSSTLTMCLGQAEVGEGLESHVGEGNLGIWSVGCIMALTFWAALGDMTGEDS